jgi:hypothetical protein
LHWGYISGRLPESPATHPVARVTRSQSIFFIKQLISRILRKPQKWVNFAYLYPESHKNRSFPSRKPMPTAEYSK